MPTVHDIWGNDVEITNDYISHRNRLIDVHLIHTFHTKGKRLLVNTFKQNEHVPTMCIFFESKETAEQAYQVMKEVFYGHSKPLALVTQDSDIRSDLGYAMFIAFMALPIIMAFVAAYK